MQKMILDVTCGNRGIWFNKNHPAAVYCDQRREQFAGTFGTKQSLRELDINPDVLCDFRNLPFSDNTFSLVVFDPPHIKGLTDSSWTKKEYGTLPDKWESILHDGFMECMRVLKCGGVLVFKWSEAQIPAQDVWNAIGQKPLFGHHSGKKMNTFWGCFMKFEADEQGET